MKVFDLKSMKAYPFEERYKNVFYDADEFKTRIVELEPGGEIPTREMKSYVIFYVVSGSAEVRVDGDVVNLKEGQCLITEPATLSMRSENGVRIMGIQIMKRSE